MVRKGLVMKKVFVSVIVIILIVLGWHYRFSIYKYFTAKFPSLAQNPLVESIKEDISAPPPLISNIFSPSAHLTVEGTIEQTNLNRQQNGGLPALRENTKLDQAAQAKLADMFKQQYFEHVNPQGVGPGDLAKKAGYNYLAEGENLALGNFDDDEVLVTAWMNSPGHRANILNTHYTEIGVAVGQGMYEGKKTWLAVQEFGRPASDCPSVDPNLKAEINSQEADINSMDGELKTEKAQLDAMHPQTQQEYDDYKNKLDEYNNEVHLYNNKIDQVKQLVSQYNNQINSYNSCLGSS